VASLLVGGFAAVRDLVYWGGSPLV